MGGGGWGGVRRDYIIKTESCVTTFASGTHSTVIPSVPQFQVLVVLVSFSCCFCLFVLLGGGLFSAHFLFLINTAI